MSSDVMDTTAVSDGDDQLDMKLDVSNTGSVKSSKMEALPNMDPKDNDKNGDIPVANCEPDTKSTVVNGDCPMASEEGVNKRKVEHEDLDDEILEEQSSSVKKSKVEAVEADVPAKPENTNSAIVNGDIDHENISESSNIPNENGGEESIERPSPSKTEETLPPPVPSEQVPSETTTASEPMDCVVSNMEQDEESNEIGVVNLAVTKSEHFDSAIEHVESNDKITVDPQPKSTVTDPPPKSSATDIEPDTMVVTESGDTGTGSATAEEPAGDGSATAKEPAGDGSATTKEPAGDAPIDLTAVTKPAGSDIVMLSDEEQEQPVNGFIPTTPEDVKKRRNLVSCLQDDLRNEEAKLVLLKKIRQSQLLQPVPEPAPPNKTTQQASSSNRAPQAGPPPLVKGPQQMTGHKQLYTGNSQPPQLTRVMPNSQLNPSRNLSRSSQNQGPPPLVMAPTARGHSQSQHPQSRHQSSSSHHVQSSRSSSSQPTAAQPQVPTQPEQTPAQRQAAAKLALRKQLEKTLLQIPAPKPPPPEMNFIPSLAGNDFMLLVGLEEVVKFIVDIDARAKGEKGPEVKYVFNPFVCVQCGTDFTPVWKRDKPGSKNVICEQCVTSNQKKALKQEHTNRLKTAFVKALQQEQEIEQRMQAQTSSSASSNSTASSSHHSSSRDRESNRDKDRDRERDRDRDRDREHHHHREESSSHGSSRSHGQHSSSHNQHTSSSSHTSHRASPSANAAANPVNLSTNFKPTNEQIRQHQNLIQAHQAQLRGGILPGMPSGFNPRLMYPFTPQHLAGSSSSSKADLQRQYLLDMIPRSMPGGSVLWRT